MAVPGYEQARALIGWLETGYQATSLEERSSAKKMAKDMPF